MSLSGLLSTTTGELLLRCAVNIYYCVCRYWAVEMIREKRGSTAQLWLVILKCFWFRLTVQGILTAFQVSCMCMHCTLYKQHC